MYDCATSFIDVWCNTQDSATISINIEHMYEHAVIFHRSWMNTHNSTTFSSTFNQNAHSIQEYIMNGWSSGKHEASQEFSCSWAQIGLGRVNCLWYFSLRLSKHMGLARWNDRYVGKYQGVAKSKDSLTQTSQVFYFRRIIHALKLNSIFIKLKHFMLNRFSELLMHFMIHRCGPGLLAGLPFPQIA